MTDEHNPAPDTPRCAVCSRRPQPEQSQVCHPCDAGLAADLDAIPTLAALIPAAVAPSLAQPLTIGSRSTDAPLPGGDALNLTARTVDRVPVRLVPHVRTVRTVELIEVPGHRPVEHTQFARELVLGGDGRPEWIPDGDQFGDLGPWVMVTRWCTHWAALRGLGEVGIGVGWLAERLDWACRAHPDIAGWAAELHAVVGGMRAVLGVKPHVVRYRDRCPRCDSAGTLWRLIDPMLPEDDLRVKYINCGNRECGTMFELDDERIQGDERRAA